MDPLSITASTIAVLSALETAFQLIKSYRDAPTQLEALSNEIVDITAAVAEVARVVTQNKDGALSEKGSHLTLALSNIREKARELEALFLSCVKGPASMLGDIKFSRTSWLRVKWRVQNIQTELRDGRLKLSIALATFTAYVLS